MTDAQEPREYGVYGPGTYADQTFTTVPDDTERIFRLLASQTPGFTQDEALLSKVRFVGEEYPVLPGPIKAVSVAAAVHAMAGVIADEILAMRGLENKAREVTISTTHAAFWLGTAAVLYLDGQSLASLGQQKKLKSLLPDWERGWHSTPLKLRATGIYPTRTPDVWYCLHGSMNVPPMLRSLGIDPGEPGIDTNDKAAAHIAAVAAQHSAEELEMRNLLGGFCGSICFTPQGWADSPMGKALAAHPLVNVRPQTHSQHTAPVPFPPLPRPTEGGDGIAEDNRPLAGIKVVELTRVIAGPQIGAMLAAFGADVIRVSAPHLPDLNTLQLTLNAGKQTVGLDLRDAGDRARLQTLVEQADVFVQGFRPGRLAAAPYNLGIEDLLGMAARRDRGIVYVSESCYGPDGYYAERPGWQQVADCAAGAAHVTGRALGLSGSECVLPPLPISDMTAGAVGAVGAMLALRDRARHGGSYAVHSALVAANTYALSREVGLYAPETVRVCQQRFRWPEMRAHHHVLDLLQMVWHGWTATEPLTSYLREDSGWFQTFDESAFTAGDGKRLRLSILRPVVRFVVDGEEEAGVEPRWLSPSVLHAHQSKDLVGFK
ncbi:CoA-transferase family III domain-containing protein [Lasiosphaeria miniovina]|uniref:CoA-transferase family III domain-containing protein n=1 Tax=Lasiosphaeria miniovina TaxID=1954250 RepID=A0AA40ABB5_9PEZI|nr:CoA-transferase family III domain-containing protein [Lasiosphaeria miniovina]KAK0712739.1 CoA-transferase family III domain-containing protein [Lasiosphaeria miniovina]